MERTQRGFPLAKNPLGIKASMKLIDDWLKLTYGAIRPTNPPANLFWKGWQPPTLYTWEEMIERGGGIGPDRLITFDQLTENRFIRSAARQWFIEGKQKDYSFYSDPSYPYLTLFCYIIMTGRTVSTEAWDLCKSEHADVNGTTVFLAGGTLWEAVVLLRRGIQKIVVSNFQTPQVSFYEWAVKQLGFADRVMFTNETGVPAHDDVLIANEYLEHFERPIEELERLMINKPLAIYHRDGFNLVGHGHPIPLDFSKFEGAPNSVYGHFEADEIFDLYCSSLDDYKFSFVTGGWRDSVRKMKRQPKREEFQQMSPLGRLLSNKPISISA